MSIIQMTPAEFRAKYLKNLTTEVKNQQKYLEATRTFNQTGEPSELSDLRTVDEKTTDLEGLKNLIIKELETLTDRGNASSFVNSITNVNSPDLSIKQLKNFYQFFPNFEAEVKKRFRYGVSSTILLDFYRKYTANFNEENYGIETPLTSESIAKAISDQFKKDNDEEEMNREYRKYIEEEGLIKKDVISKEAEKIKEKRDQRKKTEENKKNVIEELNIKKRLEELNKQKKDIEKQEENKRILIDELKQNIKLSKDIEEIKELKRIKKEEDEKFKLILKEREDLLKEIRNKEREKRKNEEDIFEKLYLQEKEKEKEYYFLPKSEEIEKERKDIGTQANFLNIKSQNIENYGDPNKRASGPFDKDRKEMITFLYSNIKNIENEEERNEAIRILEKYPIKMDPNEARMKFNRNPEDWTNLYKLSNGIPLYGSGIKNFKSKKVIKGKGIIKSNKGNKLAEFGRYYIDPNLLEENIISMKNNAEMRRPLPQIPTKKVSQRVSNVVKKIVGGAISLSYEDVIDLDDNEKIYLNDLVKKVKLNDVVKIPVPDKDKIQKEMDRFELLKGQILSGNDSKELIKEFKILLLKFQKEGKLPKREVNEILYELMILS